MIYAMNVYDLKADKEDVYKEYIKKTAEVAADIQGEVVIAGHNPIKTLSGNGRSHFAVIKFPSLEAFETMIELQNQNELHELRESVTENYLWTLYEEWDLLSWLNSK